MATQSVTNVATGGVSTASVWRAECEKIADGLDAVGFTRTADTGQVDWASVSSTSGYEVRALGDVVTKWTYGASGGYMTLSISAALASDGAGTLISPIFSHGVLGGNMSYTGNMRHFYMSLVGGHFTMFARSSVPASYPGVAKYCLGPGPNENDFYVLTGAGDYSSEGVNNGSHLYRHSPQVTKTGMPWSCVKPVGIVGSPDAQNLDIFPMVPLTWGNAAIASDFPPIVGYWKDEISEGSTFTLTNGRTYRATAGIHSADVDVMLAQRWE